MHALTAWFARNPVAANLLMGLALIGGLFALQTTRIEGFPAIPPRSVTVTTVYPGASAEQVDRGVSRRVEQALRGVPGVKKVSSLSGQGFSSVSVEKKSGFGIERFQNEIGARIDSIFNLPERAERPRITRDEFDIEALVVQVYGDVEPLALQRAARLVREELLSDPEITKLETFGEQEYEVRVEVDDALLRTHGLSVADVATAISASSLDYRTGSLRSEDGLVTIRADRRAFDSAEFAEIAVKTLPDGAQLRVRDIGVVVDGFREDVRFARFQGVPSVGFQIFTSKSGSLLDVSRAARDVAERLRPHLPQGIEIDLWGDYSIYMRDRLALLGNNAWQGLLIVFVILALFLNVRVAFWVAMGIPISIAGTLVLMGDRFLGQSLNDITTFGIIVVLGIVVDDAIVVGESVFAARASGDDPTEATIRGVNRVSTATVFGCLTTVAALYPLLLIDNDIGKIFASFAVVAITALLVSLVESKLILPAHLAGVPVGPGVPRALLGRVWRGLQAFAAGALGLASERVYRPILAFALRHRYAVLIAFVSLATGVLTLMSTGWIRTVFFPAVPGQIITVNLRMTNGSSLALTRANVDVIERAAEELNAAAGVETPPIVRIMTALTSETSAEIYAELRPERERSAQTLRTLRAWRTRTGQLEGAEELTFSGSFETGGGFAVALAARDEAVLEEVIARFTDQLARIPGVDDVRDNLRQGNPRIRLKLRPEARHLGLTVEDLARQIGDAFGGLEIQRFQRGADEVRVVVSALRERRRDTRDILDTRVRTATGAWVPVSLVATLEPGVVPSEIFRENGRRLAYVSASINNSVTSAAEVFRRITREVAPDLQDAYPQLEIRGAGELEEIGEIRGGLIRALVMTTLLIYALLAVPLRSYSKPIVIMAVVPFGFVGAGIGHALMGHPLSILSLFGMLAVAGIVVNDSLVMMTRLNALRADGVPLHDALLEAGRSRFRPILLTTLTTVCGMLPLLTERSEQAQYLIPAAVSLVWGELFATPITLVIVPVLVAIGHDLRSLAASGPPAPRVGREA